MCVPQHRCPDGATQYNMSTTPVRSYCFDDNDFTRIKNNGSYDVVDRSDEDPFRSSVTSAQGINYTAVLTQCTVRDRDAGVKCDGDCVHAVYWCNDNSENYCSDSGVRRTDAGLCSHPTFWKEISCNLTYGGQLYPGLRCTGAIKQCYYPQGSLDEDYWPTTCRDKSDRVFQVGKLSLIHI